MSEKNIYEKIMTVRQKFKNRKDIKKSGENKFQGFKYYELSDIVPPTIDLCNEVGLYTHIDVGITLPNIDGIYAKMQVINTANVEEKVEYLIKMPYIADEGGFNAKIQDTGKGQTYIRRYLYMLFLDLAIPDEVDSANNSSKIKKPKNMKKVKLPTKR